MPLPPHATSASLTSSPCLARNCHLALRTCALTTQVSNPLIRRPSPSSLSLPTAGLVSKAGYLHGVFTASLKLPSGFSAGVVTTFYLTSNFGSQTPQQQSHQDEADFEFLGDTTSKKIRVGTNYYAHGVGTNTHEEGVSLIRVSEMRMRKLQFGIRDPGWHSRSFLPSYSSYVSFHTPILKNK